MGLNTVQFQQLKDFLNSYNLRHEDLKHEILDHLATGIETDMIEGYSFNEAFDKAFNIWDKELSRNESKWLGKGPKIIIDKSERLLKKLSIDVFVKTILVTVILYLLFKFLDLNNYMNWFSYILIGVYLIVMVLLFYGNLKIGYTHYKTSYGFLYDLVLKSGGVIVFIALNPLINSSVRLTSGKDEFIPLFFYSLVIFLSYELFKLNKLHFKTGKIQFV